MKINGKVTVASLNLKRMKLLLVTQTERVSLQHSACTVVLRSESNKLPKELNILTIEFSFEYF